MCRWLERAQPDILLLQETKCEATAFPALSFHGLGYTAEAVGQKAYNGVAVLSRVPFRSPTAGCPACPTTTPRRATSRSKQTELPLSGSTCRTATRAATPDMPTSSPGWTGSATAPRRCCSRSPDCHRRRLQRVPGRRGCLTRHAPADRRAGAAGNPGPVPPPALAGADRRHARAAPARAGVHVLGLSGRRLAAGPGAAHRPRRCCPRLSPNGSPLRNPIGRNAASRSRPITCPWWWN